MDKFATNSINSILNNKTSPRIGILGATTFPSGEDFGKSQMAVSKQALTEVQEQEGSQLGGSKVDDVSVSVNK